MTDQQIHSSTSRLGLGVTLGAVLGVVALYCWLVHFGLGVVATVMLLAVSWLVGRAPGRHNSGVAVLASAVAVGLVLFVILAIWGSAVGS